MGWSAGNGENGDFWGTGDLRAGGRDHIDLAALPDGVLHLTVSAESGADPELGHVEIHKDGDYVLLAASAGLGVVLRDGKIWGCRPVPPAVPA